MRFKKKKKIKSKEPPVVKIIAVCPRCQQENGLQSIRNYICHNCSKSVLFFSDTKNTKPHPDAPTFLCPDCGLQTFKGIKFCPRCGEVHIK